MIEDWKGYDTDSIVVLHYKDGEIIEELKGIYNADGTISFETDSFSTFAIVAAAKAENPEEQKKRRIRAPLNQRVKQAKQLRQKELKQGIRSPIG